MLVLVPLVLVPLVLVRVTVEARGLALVVTVLQ